MLVALRHLHPTIDGHYRCNRTHNAQQQREHYAVKWHVALNADSAIYPYAEPETDHSSQEPPDGRASNNHE